MGASSTATQPLGDALSTTTYPTTNSTASITSEEASSNQLKIKPKDPVWKLAIGLAVALGVLFVAVAVLGAVLWKRRRNRPIEASVEEGPAPQGSPLQVETQESVSMDIARAVAAMEEKRAVLEEEAAQPNDPVNELETREIVEAPDTQVRLRAELNVEPPAATEMAVAG
ncbi:hypothetical protein BJ508DRAFT_69233 [Ascobolus immersus RN42]|uniref:Mid2 domain-containing protein n=1 Tax=Ascobolus immersus RN42 TaxID=1160509 RepID=A0A3N4HEL8_ASCIM|nr:hypothetical protein BJ508DRAFT_69233 [Ascobolus immersus RN42]